MLAIIGGSGFRSLESLGSARCERVKTPYGEPSDALTFGRLGEENVVFIARHGDGHTIPPHRVNYRANIWALAQVAKATRIISIASVGGIRADLPPGALLVPHQLIDCTQGRSNSFFDGADGRVIHIDFTHPYDAQLRATILHAARDCGEAACDGGIYAAMQGPRLETAAEIDRLERDGADVVGMTGMPEAALARELGIPYAAICLVVNWAAGRGDSRDGIMPDRMEAQLQTGSMRVHCVLEQLCHKELVHDP